MYLMESGGINGAVGSTPEIRGVPLLSVLEEADIAWGLPIQKVTRSCFFSLLNTFSVRVVAQCTILILHHLCELIKVEHALSFNK